MKISIYEKENYEEILGLILEKLLKTDNFEYSYDEVKKSLMDGFNSWLKEIEEIS